MQRSKRQTRELVTALVIDTACLFARKSANNIIFTNIPICSQRLHEQEEIPTGQQFAHKITTRFYDTLNRNKPLVKELGAYN